MQVWGGQQKMEMCGYQKHTADLMLLTGMFNIRMEITHLYIQMNKSDVMVKKISKKFILLGGISRPGVDVITSLRLTRLITLINFLKI